MNCVDIQGELLDAAGRAEQPGGALGAHLSGCQDCRAAWGDITFSMSALDDLAPEQAPEVAAAAVRTEIRQSLEAGGRAPVAIAMAVGFGLLSALVSLAMLGARLDLSSQPTWTVVAGGVAWVAMFILAFWMVLRPSAHRRNLQSLVLTGLGAMGVFMVADSLLPLTRVVQFCYQSSWAREHLGVLGAQGAFFVVGAAYALVPLFLLSMASGRRAQKGPVHGGLVAGGMFFFLLAPAIFIQCGAFTAGSLVAWLGGAVIGSTVGGVAGYWVHQRRGCRSHPDALFRAFRGFFSGFGVMSTTLART